MLNVHDDMIPVPMAQAIEDAILFGNIQEIDAVLDVIEGDKDFPEELRYGLQALRYFRAHYGKGEVLEPDAHIQKQKVAIMESAWGAELLDMLKHNEASTARSA